MKITIRNAKLADIDRIAEIESTCFPEAEAATRESIEDRASTYPEGFFVACKGDIIVGFINGARTNKSAIHDEFFETMENHDPSGKHFVIFSLGVSPKHQQKGIARELMNHLLSYCKDSKLDKALLTCKDHLIKYYESFGYVNDGVSGSVHGGAKWYDMRLDI